MASASLAEITRYCDRLLRTSEIKDYDGAANGLQVENRGRINRIMAAVDASASTVDIAIESEADLLIVHHGLFWAPSHPWTGRRYQLLRRLIENDLAVYSSHLPLDLHPRLGNNRLLANALGFRKLKPFFLKHGEPLGCKTIARVDREELAARLASATGNRVTVLPGGPRACRRIGIVTGGAGGQLLQAVAEGVDTFITGEGPHWTFATAEEAGINVLYGGHYATETFGVKALAKHLSQRFGVSWGVIDYPTGL
jgi:dinuclear metal center YbgI/SA1388 family protein